MSKRDWKLYFEDILEYHFSLVRLFLPQEAECF